MSTSVNVAPAAFRDRLYLDAASGLPQFRPVYDALSTIEVYNLNPKEIANLQKPDASQVLRRDGGIWGAKEWLAARLPAGYDPPNHQPLFTEHFSFAQAAAVPPFARQQRKAQALFSS